MSVLVWMMVSSVSEGYVSKLSVNYVSVTKNQTEEKRREEKKIYKYIYKFDEWVAE